MSAPRRNKVSSEEIQAVLFEKKHFNAPKARKWLKQQNIIPMKVVHKTANYLRYRIQDPSQFRRFVMKPTPNPHVKFVIGFT